MWTIRSSLDIVKMWLRPVRCRLRQCPGRVVSGTHSTYRDGRVHREIWVGWQCVDCGTVKHYQPVRDVPSVGRTV